MFVFHTSPDFAKEASLQDFGQVAEAAQTMLQYSSPDVLTTLSPSQILRASFTSPNEVNHIFASAVVCNTGWVDWKFQTEPCVQVSW